MLFKTLSDCLLSRKVWFTKAKTVNDRELEGDLIQEGKTFLKELNFFFWIVRVWL